MGHLFRYYHCATCQHRQRVRERGKPNPCSKCGGEEFEINPAWNIQYMYRNKAIRKKIGSQERAVYELKRIESDVLYGKHRLNKSRQTVKEFAYGDYWTYYGSRLADARSTRSRLTNHIIPRYGHLYLDQLDAEDIEQMVAELDDEYPVSTVNKILSALKSVYREAHRRKLIAANPAREVKTRKEDNQGIRFLTEDEYGRLIEAAGDPLLRAAIALAVGTLLRKGNLYGLKWSHCDMERRQIILPADLTKNREQLPIPMIGPVHDVLSALPRGLHSQYVLINPRTGDRFKQGMRKQFDRAKRTAGIELSFRWHDLRHTGISWLVMAGVPLTTVQKLAGHKRHETTLRYAHFSPDYMREQAERLTAFMEHSGNLEEEKNASG